MPNYFFRNYVERARVRGEEVNPEDETYAYADTQDEAALVWALVQLRLGRRHFNIVSEALKRPLAPAEEGALQFVTTIWCVFIVKPRLYQLQIEGFKRYFVPGFATDGDKQRQLQEGVRARFMTTPLEDVDWRKVDLGFFFDETILERLPVPEPA